MRVPRTRQEILKHLWRDRGWKYLPGEVAAAARLTGKKLPLAAIFAGSAGKSCRV
jgi:hypothetical protein